MLELYDAAKLLALIELEAGYAVDLLRDQGESGSDSFERFRFAQGRGLTGCRRRVLRSRSIRYHALPKFTYLHILDVQ